MASWVYEGLLIFALSAVTVFVLRCLSEGLTGEARAAYMAYEIGVMQAAIFVVLGVYFSWCWSKGQTLPMKTWRLRITDRQGRSVSKLRAAARYALAWLLVLPPLFAMSFSDLSKGRLYGFLAAWLALYLLHARLQPSKQFLHDRLAGTKLVVI